MAPNQDLGASHVHHHILWIINDCRLTFWNVKTWAELLKILFSSSDDPYVQKQTFFIWISQLVSNRILTYFRVLNIKWVYYICTNFIQFYIYSGQPIMQMALLNKQCKQQNTNQPIILRVHIVQAKPMQDWFWLVAKSTSLCTYFFIEV